MKKLLMMTALAVITTTQAVTEKFKLQISSKKINVTKNLELSDIGEGKTKINFDFKSKKGEKYNFNLNYKNLPSNRSYPTNLDITIKDAKGNKLGYLFFAINGVSFLKKVGTWGMVVRIDNEPVDFKFVFDANKSGHLKLEQFENERMVQDTLVSKFGFQMIRPIIAPKVADGIRSQTYSLDAHPYSVNYTLKDLGDGIIQFQHNLYSTKNGSETLLERIYYNSDCIETFREGMYAAKYFDKVNGAFKLVFYPAMGQTTPKK